MVVTHEIVCSILGIFIVRSKIDDNYIFLNEKFPGLSPVFDTYLGEVIQFSFVQNGVMTLVGWDGGEESGRDVSKPPVTGPVT